MSLTETYNKIAAGLQYCTILSLNNSRLHLVQVLFDTQLFVFDHLLLLVHSFLDLLAHHLKYSSIRSCNCSRLKT